MRHLYSVYFVAAALLVFDVSGSRAQGTAQQILSATGIQAGVCAVLTPADALLVEGLTNDGRMLVHVLTTSSSSMKTLRSELQARGIYGVATVEGCGGYGQLPYADNMVNLLIADLDKPGAQAPTTAEILRVVVPGGVYYVKRGGAWTTSRKPVPGEMDDWPHWNNKSDMNPLSHDKLVGVPTGIKWIAWYTALANNGEGLHGANGWGARLAGGRAFQKLLFKDGKTENWIEDARDAYNGVLLWNRKLDAGATRSTTPRDVATPGLLYTVLGSTTGAGKMVALDATTGTVVKTFVNGGTWSKTTHSTEAVLIGRTLIQASGDKLYALDTATGNLKWSYQDTPGLRMVLPAGFEKDNRVYAAVAASPTSAMSGRFPHIRVSAIVALNLASGERTWRSTDFVGKGGGPNPYPLLAQIACSGNYLSMFADGNYGDPMMGMLDASNGKCLWVSDYQVWKRSPDPRPGIDDSYFSTHPGKYFGQALVFRDGALYIMTKTKVASINPLDGKPVRLFEPYLPNNRCSRGYATDNWFLIGFTCFINSSYQFTYRNITRSTCGSGSIPGCGQLFYGPNGECGCANWLRTATSLSCEQLPPTVETPARLTRYALSKALLKPEPDVIALSKGMRMPVVPTRKPVIGGKPIRSDWNNNDLIPATETTPVTAGDRVYVAVVNEHRMECRRNGQTVWSFTAAGRISGAPVLTGGLCIFGSHDGRVYTLDSNTGAPVWKFLGARADRRIVAFSQLESASPVFGVTLHEGNVCFSAGRNPEIDGGIYVWGLRPATAEVVWKGVISSLPGLQTEESKVFATYRNNTVNSVLVSDGGYLKLENLVIDPNNPGNQVAAGKREVVNRRAKISAVSQNDGVALDLGDGLDIPVSIRVFNLRGETCMTQTVYAGSKTFLPLSALGAGLYRVVVDGRGGEKLAIDVRVKH